MPSSIDSIYSRRATIGIQQLGRKPDPAHRRGPKQLTVRRKPARTRLPTHKASRIEELLPHHWRLVAAAWAMAECHIPLSRWEGWKLTTYRCQIGVDLNISYRTLLLWQRAITGQTYLWMICALLPADNKPCGQAFDAVLRVDDQALVPLPNFAAVVLQKFGCTGRCIEH